MSSSRMPFSAGLFLAITALSACASNPGSTNTKYETSLREPIGPETAVLSIPDPIAPNVTGIFSIWHKNIYTEVIHLDNGAQWSYFHLQSSSAPAIPIDNEKFQKLFHNLQWDGLNIGEADFDTLAHRKDIGLQMAQFLLPNRSNDNNELRINCLAVYRTMARFSGMLVGYECRKPPTSLDSFMDDILETAVAFEFGRDSLRRSPGPAAKPVSPN